MFFDAEGKAIPCPDPSAGLYIRTRQGATVRAVIPPDCVALQIGETITVTVVEVRKGVVTLRIECPREVPVYRADKGHTKPASENR